MHVLRCDSHNVYKVIATVKSTVLDALSALTCQSSAGAGRCEFVGNLLYCLRRVTIRYFRHSCRPECETPTLQPACMSYCFETCHNSCMTAHTCIMGPRQLYRQLGRLADIASACYTSTCTCFQKVQLLGEVTNYPRCMLLDTALV